MNSEPQRVLSVEHFTEQVGATSDKFPVCRVRVPKPPFANKGYCIESKGLYVFEEGPGVLIAVAVTHFGEGTVRVMDTRLGKNMVPDNEARLLYKATSQTMCLWMLSAGFSEGLVVDARGTGRDNPVFMSLSWSALEE